MGHLIDFCGTENPVRIYQNEERPRTGPLADGLCNKGKGEDLPAGFNGPDVFAQTRRVCVLASIKKTDGLSILPS